MAKAFNLITSGITGTYPERFAKAMAMQSSLQGQIMEIMSLRGTHNRLRRLLGYNPTPFQIWRDLQMKAGLFGNVGRTVAFSAPNLTQDDRLRAFTSLSPLVPGPWVLCQVLATPQQARDGYIAHEYTEEPSEKTRQRILEKTTKEYGMLEIAHPEEGFAEIVFLDINGNPTNPADWRAQRD